MHPAAQDKRSGVGKKVVLVIAGLDPRVSGTFCAFMPLSPLRHKPAVPDGVEPLGWRPPQSQISSVVARVLVAVMIEEVPRLVVDA